MMKFLGRMVAEIVPDRYQKSAYDIHPGANHFLDLVEQERYDELTAQFVPVSRSEKTLLIEAVSEIVQQNDFFDYWTTIQDSPMASLMRGALLIVRAGYYRGGGLGSDFEGDDYNNMRNAFRASISVLDRIRTDEIFGQEAAAWMLLATLTSGFDWEFRNEVFADLRSVPEPHITGELRYLVATCEKWFGSHDDMFRHARNTQVRYPTHPEIGAVLAAAHYERHLHFARFDQDLDAARTYITSPDTIDELVGVSTRLLSSPPPSPLDYIQAHNVFAAVFCVAERYDLAKPHFLGMEGRVLTFPWYYHSDADLQRWYNRAIRS